MTFEEFARDQLPALLRFAKALCVDRGTAEDVVQEVLLRAQPRWSDIGRREQPAAYVRRMIVNEYLSWRRKWTRIVPAEHLPERDAAPDPAGSVADHALLVAQLAQLPPRQRAVVVLRYFGDLTEPEIAAELGCAVTTVRSHLSRALATLRVRPELKEAAR